MDQKINLNIIFGNKTYLFDIKKDQLHEDFIFNIFLKNYQN